MKKLVFVNAFLFILVFLITSPGRSEDLKASLPLLPPLVVNENSGILVDLVKAIDEVYTQGAISIKVFPFARSIENVVEGNADFHMPFLVNPSIPADKLNFMYSSDIIFRVVFVLYVNRNNNRITAKNAGEFKIETDRAHVDYFDFPIKPSNSIESSLKKVDMGRIDGFIFAMPETDGTLKKLGLKNIKRLNYQTFDVRIILPRGDRGQKIDGILSEAIGVLKRTGDMKRSWVRF